MERFILEGDYAMQIKEEIAKLLTNPTNWFLSPKLIRAEQTAISQIRNHIAKRYDCDAIFAPASDTEDNRDQFIVTIVIDIALYHLYSQTGLRDIPEHRQQRYQDAIEWLKDVGSGNISADLPELIYDDGQTYGNFIINSREPQNHKF
jgi:phage gp36-like protein